MLTVRKFGIVFSLSECDGYIMSHFFTVETYSDERAGGMCLESTFLSRLLSIK